MYVCMYVRNYVCQSHYLCVLCVFLLQIFNLSERSYDISRFNNQVRHLCMCIADSVMSCHEPLLVQWMYIYMYMFRSVLPSPLYPSHVGTGLWMARPPRPLPREAVLCLPLYEVLAGHWPSTRGGRPLQGRQGTYWVCHSCLYELLRDMPEVYHMYIHTCMMIMYMYTLMYILWLSCNL